jgi:hypothetical protein
MEIKKEHKMLLQSLKESDQSENKSKGGRIILKEILSKQAGSCGLDSCGSGQESAAASCEHVNKKWGSINDT